MFSLGEEATFFPLVGSEVVPDVVSSTHIQWALIMGDKTGLAQVDELLTDEYDKYQHLFYVLILWHF